MSLSNQDIETIRRIVRKVLREELEAFKQKLEGEERRANHELYKQVASLQSEVDTHRIIGGD